MIFCFSKLSKVRILLQVADQAKKVTLKGALLRQIHFQGKGVLSWGLYIIELSYIKQPSLGEVPTKLVYTVLFQFDGIQLIKTRKIIPTPNHALF